jgi:hypothetical protein
VEEVGKIATEVCLTIAKLMHSPDAIKDKKSDSGENKNEKKAPQQGSGNGSGANDSDSNESTEDSEDQPQPSNMGSSEATAATAAFAKQRKFLSSDFGKKAVSSKMKHKLDNLKDMAADIQSLEDGKFTAVLQNLDSSQQTLNDFITTSDAMLACMDKYEAQNISVHDPKNKEAYAEYMELREKSKALQDALPTGFCYKADSGVDDAIKKGLELGAILGKKLQIRNEVRELVYNRMRTGGIDNKRLAQAGFGVETIFKQIHTDQYKKANLNISLDASGSMGGPKWINTVQMTVAICKAAEYIKNLSIQVNLRGTTGRSGEQPEVVHIYDTRKNKLNHLIKILSHYSPTSYTPEGLCFEAMIKKNNFIRSSNTMDSYFLNISDGMPGGVRGYEGSYAYDHTRKQMETLRKEYGINILSFFVTDTGRDVISSSFQHMYSVKDSKCVPADSVVEIARVLNEKFTNSASKL